MDAMSLLSRLVGPNGQIAQLKSQFDRAVKDVDSGIAQCVRDVLHRVDWDRNN
jgi:hypothetical protein